MGGLRLLIYSNGSRCKILIYIASVCKNKRNKVHVTKAGLNQRFLRKAERATSNDVFNIIQKRPNTVLHLNADEATESRRSHRK